MTRASERAMSAVREAILRGDFASGARLGEVELADRLGISRTPIREALSRLVSEGLVELSPHRGARVASWTVAELEGVFDLRLALEPRAAARAATRAGKNDVDRLDELAHAMQRVGAPGPQQDLDALVPLNRDFHGRLVALADHPALTTALAGAVHAPIVLRNFHAYDPDSLARSLAHHVEIVAAVRARDPDWAEAVMSAHICNARATMLGARDREEKT